MIHERFERGVDQLRDQYKPYGQHAQSPPNGFGSRYRQNSEHDCGSHDVQTKAVFANEGKPDAMQSESHPSNKRLPFHHYSPAS